MLSRGHEIFFTCREKEFELELLEKYGFPYKSFGKNYSKIYGKLWGLIKFDLMEIVSGSKFRPDIFLSHGSHHAAHASFLLRKPHISFEDTFNFEQIWLYKPLTNVILTSDYDHPLKSRKVIKYAGYHELAYLHPNRFIPDKNILLDLGVSEYEKYVIVRFVSWAASHDIGHKGITAENKIKVVNEFSKFAKVFISSEKPLPSELEKFRFKLSPHVMHDAMAFATLTYGESGTMAAESNMLGVPSIFLDNNSRYYTKDLENRYGLTFNYTESISDQERSIKKGLELLSTKSVREIWKNKRDLMLQDKIDVTAFLVWFVEHWPKSLKTMKENPDYQYNFK
jgi:hypothetical protein